MKASELLKQLESVIAKHGDADVSVNFFNDGDDGGTYSIEPIVGIFRFHNEDKSVSSFCLCDEDTMTGFQDNADPEFE